MSVTIEKQIDDVEDPYGVFKQKDFRVDQLLLMGSPVPIVLIVVSYLLFINKIGPSLMKNRPAFDLSKFLIAYNAVQVVASCYVLSLGIRLISRHGVFDLTCSSNHEPYKSFLAYAGYCYFLAKVSELLDTVFFVLRKKQNQVTFLHVYHHSLMMMSAWLSLKYENSHSATFLGTINSFIHVLMYAYYGLSAVPALRKYLWWKKYLTTMQLIQFALIITHILAFTAVSKCPPSYVLLFAIVLNGVLFIYLFSKFYIQSYLGKKNDNFKINKFVCSKVDFDENTKQKSNMDETKTNGFINNKSKSMKTQ